jgi:hypothetical protein
VLTCFLHSVTVNAVSVVAAGVIVEVAIVLHATVVAAVVGSVLACTAGGIRNKIACSPRRRERLLKR